jgi:hypothetical protein
MDIEAMKKSIIFECKNCGKKYNTRSELAKHQYHEHRKVEKKTPKFIIPRELVKELDYLGTTGYVRLLIEGELNAKGVAIETIKYA